MRTVGAYRDRARAQIPSIPGNRDAAPHVPLLVLVAKSV
jgi:hypothetical protein